MSTHTTNPEVQLADDLANFYNDPLGFVKYAYPCGARGLLEKHEGPDDWQRDFLVEPTRRRA
jgi:hypothetical protein